MMKPVTIEAVTHTHTHTHTQCNLINNKRAENKTALFWIY